MANTESTNCDNDGAEFLASIITSVQQPESAQTTEQLSKNVQSFEQGNAPAHTLANPKIVYHMRYSTSSYIAGFICRKLLKHDCPECTSA